MDDLTPPIPATQAASSSRDDLAYIAPMAIFLLLTAAGGKWPTLFAASYVLKTFLTAAVLVFFWRQYTAIRWTHWGLGVAVGVIGIFQWVGMEELLMRYWPSYPRIPGATEPFDPHHVFSTAWSAWSFIIIRWAGAALVVPFMEEFFWRDFLWRTIAAPNDFKLARIGEGDPKAFFMVALFFASVHPQWITALVWGLMIGLLLWRTGSLGACIIAHAVTNFLLGAYVQFTGNWYYW